MVYNRAGAPGLEKSRIGNRHVLKHAAWHCSYCFGILTEAVAKLNSFSHREYNKWEFKDPRNILDRVRFRSDL